MNTRKSTKAFSAAIQSLQDSTRTGLEASQIHFLLLAYETGPSGQTMTDIALKLKQSNSSAGRNAALMTTHGVKHARTGKLSGGWGLVEIGYDPTQPRSKMVTITQKGIEVVERCLAELK